jgi:tetratricopeptide (TPR) repeat protein
MDSETEYSGKLTDAEHHLGRAYELEEKEEHHEALSMCDEAARVAQVLLADAYNLRGIVLEELGRNEEALEAYKRALFIEPDFREAADNLLALESELGAGHRLVTVAAFSQATEAHIQKSKLDAEGIWSFVADEHLITWNWLYSNAIGGVKLQVREADVERALEALGIELPGTVVGWETLDVEDDESRCPNCNSFNIHYERYAQRPLFASWLLLGFPLPFLKRKWKCYDCDHEWKL